MSTKISCAGSKTEKQQKYLSNILYTALFNLCILMDFPILINKIRMGMSNIYFKGSQAEIFK